MYNLKKMFLFSLLFICTSNKAQDYYPLQVGNAWYIGANPSKIIGDTVFNGKKYSIFMNTSMQRVDEDGNVLEGYPDSTEAILYKLNTFIGDSWDTRLPMGGYNIIKHTTLESKDDIVITNDTVFTNCIRYYIRFSNMFDADYKIWLAPGVGIVKSKSMGWGLDSSVLIKALINRKRIPDRIIPPKITEILPENNQDNIPVDVQLAVLFDLVIRKELINSDNIKIYSVKKGTVPFKFANPYETRDIRFTPYELFEYSDTITVVISSSICDYMDDHLSEDYIFSFTTEPFLVQETLFQKDNALSTIKLAGDFDFGDYDNDADLDLVIFGNIDTVDSGYKPFINVFKNDDGIFIPCSYEFNPTNAQGYQDCVKWADFNADGKLDIVFSGFDTLNNQNIPVTRFYKNNSSSFEYLPAMDLPYGPARMDWGDFNNDTYPDLAINGSTTPYGTGAIYLNDKGNLKRYFDLGPMNAPVRWLDFDNDKDIDLLAFNKDYASFIRNNNGTLQKVSYMVIDLRLFETYSFSFDYGDLNSDGIPEFLINNNIFTKSDNVYFPEANSRNGSFSSFVDFDKDGDMDIFTIGGIQDIVGKYRTYFWIYQNVNNEFSLYKKYQFKNYTYVHSAEWLDINKDGKIDLAALTENGMEIFYNVMTETSVKPPKGNPSEFYLSQNYPNPFNPITKINYSVITLSTSSFLRERGGIFVSLKVYDILGNEVATLVNEEKPAGEYEVEFDGSKFSSGIYFYNLISGEKCLTGKMNLIK